MRMRGHEMLKLRAILRDVLISHAKLVIIREMAIKYLQVFYAI